MFNLLAKKDNRVFFVFRLRSVRICCPVFNLYSKFTFIMLWIFAIMLTAKELILLEGRPIKCTLMFESMKDVNGGKDLERVISSYCWVQPTFLVLPNELRGNITHSYQGLTNHRGVPADIKYYAYYQWVPVVLFVQGVLCFLPWYFWKNWDNGFMFDISGNLQDAYKDKEKRDKSKAALIKYLVENLNFHGWYASAYWVAEGSCFFGVIGQMFFMDWFFSGEFKSYGLNLLGLFQLSDINPGVRFDPFIFIFPRMTKCTFRKFGPTNTIEVYDAMCILVLNNTNEKIYFFLWFWYGILAMLTAGVIFYRILIILLPSLRLRLLCRRNQMVSLDSATVIANTSASDWWIFYMLGRNMNPLLFREVTAEYANRVKAIKEAAKEIKVL